MVLSRWAANCTASVVGWPVAHYIQTQRNRLAPAATPLSIDFKLRLRNYFSDADLERVRIVEQDPLPIPDPPFYPVLWRLRLDFPRPSLVAAITFGDVIAARETMTDQLLFHELVHVAQYRLLGVKTFARLYVRGFLAGGSYQDIPLERCAFELDLRFAMEGRPFSVEAEVQEWLERSLF
jgi:hypothetical protein